MEKCKRWACFGNFFILFANFFVFWGVKEERNRFYGSFGSVNLYDMNEHQFYKAVNIKAKELNMSPLLLISGIEGLYSFKNVEIDNINYRFLDNLIITILALRIGDSFHAIAEENLKSASDELRKAAGAELKELSSEEIKHSSNMYLQSFANVMAGKSTVRKYHEKALEVAAFEVRKMQEQFQNPSIGAIILDICYDMKGNDDFAFLFRA